MRLTALLFDKPTRAPYPLYAVTQQHLLTRKNFLFLNSLKGFWRSLGEISQYFHFVDNSNHLKDLVICILWTLVVSLSDAQAMILTVILTFLQRYCVIFRISTHAEVVTYPCRNVTVVCGASQHILGSCIYFEIWRSRMTVSQILYQ
jgi:hypothetical protein